MYVVEKMTHGFRRVGREAGRGFYEYPEGEPPALWSGLRQFERRALALPECDVADRLLYAQLIASARAGASRDGSCALETADALIARIGHARFVARSSELAASYGERFALPRSLLDRAPGRSGTAA
ncbi:MAG: hypothetical protein KJZ83_09055 [Burkholderiaceae bacterium]|nr:hypothetical protein [Burkholderiaceae bacterium]